jgi:GTP-binding protein
MLSVASLEQLPDPDKPEIAFAGRSNVGKSTLLNALTGRRDLARTSNTPGRTQMLNFFRLEDRSAGGLFLVDLPGYGFAKVPKELVKRWIRLLKAYLRGRASLRRAIVLIDARHGIKPVDEEILSMMDEAAVSYQVVLTKCDKLKKGELEKRLSEVEAGLKKHVAAHPRILATSAAKGTGIAELRAELAALAG